MMAVDCRVDAFKEAVLIQATSDTMRRFSMRLNFFCVCASFVMLVSGCASHRVMKTAQAPVVVDDMVREALPNDYLRVSFVPAGVKVTTLSRPGALRAFVTATPLYSLPLKLKDLPYYSGLVNDDKNVLVAMRCQPPHPETVDAVLATWPNVFQAIERDVPQDPGGCSGEPGTTAAQAACFAKAFVDPPATVVPTSLAHTFSYAGTLYDADHAALAKWLQSNYGIFPAFSGMGYSVKDSYSLDSQPMTSQQILVKSVSSEYILKNVSLSDAGCRCISVAPYPDRSSDRLDPDFIERAGGDGVCKEVDRLPRSR
ncbi:MAG TPA: hypothetical protein VK627_01810 [Edaphobacter sp.]|nr:hypothetical protein [Edaphobacter sp.]